MIEFEINLKKIRKTHTLYAKKFIILQSVINLIIYKKKWLVKFQTVVQHAAHV